MASAKAIVTSERAALAGDACLLSAAGFGLVMGPLTLIAESGQSAGTVLEVVSGVLSLAVVILGPVIAWRLHGRRISITAVLGGVLGAAVTGFVAMLLAPISFVLEFVLRPLTDAEYAGPLALLGLVGVAFVAALVALTVDAVRDLSTVRRAHVRLDVVRLAAVVVLVVYAAAVGMWVLQHPGDESGEALIFAIAAGLAGALAVVGAEVLTAASGRPSTPMAGVPGS